MFSRSKHSRRLLAGSRAQASLIGQRTDLPIQLCTIFLIRISPALEGTHRSTCFTNAICGRRRRVTSSQASLTTHRSRPDKQAFVCTLSVFAYLLPRHIQPALARGIAATRPRSSGLSDHTTTAVSAPAYLVHPSPRTLNAELLSRCRRLTQ